MNSIKLTPTEALLQVAKSRPFAIAIRCGKTEWSYAALWQRVRELANKIDELETEGRPIGVYMGLEVDFVAAAHAAWLSGRTVVYLNSKWTPEVLSVILERSNTGLILYGDSVFPGVDGSRSVCTFDFVSREPAAFVGLPPVHESVDRVPLVCSVTPTSGSTGVPKSIVYPMSRSLDVLTEESTTLLKPRDGQWLRGGTTFLRPLFELRRFMYTQTTLYLDSATSVAGQCENFANELEDSSNMQPLRTHFTPGVFKAFVDYVKLKYGENKSWDRVYWMVIGGENLNPQDLALAKKIFPQATLACNYGCSEVGFAGVNQHYVRPDEPVPEAITFDATQGCDDLVLLNDEMEVVPCTEGASGIIGIVSSQSATRYLGNDAATAHMFRPWGGARMLLYTDDIGHIAKDGRIAIKGRRSRNVKINGLFVDLDFVERALVQAFSPEVLGHGVAAYKLVKSSSEKIIMFWTGEAAEMDVLRRVRETLRAQLGDNLAMVVSSTRKLPEMPYNASYKVDLAKLQTFADETPAASELAPEPAAPAKNAVQEVASAIAEEVARLSNAPGAVPIDVPLMLAGLNSITVVQLNFWLQTRYDWDDDMVRLFEDDATAEAIARDIVGEAAESASASDSDEEAPAAVSKVTEIAQAVAAQVKKLSRSNEAVPTDVPLTLAGLNSITVVQLHFWLQSTYDYEEDMSRLFEEDVSAEVVARDILGAAPVESESAYEAQSECGESETDSSEQMDIARAIAKEIGTYCRALGPVPTDVPLVMAGLNSITAVQLYSWLQATYDFDDEMSRLLDHSVTAEVLAQDILGSSPASSEAPETPQDVIEVVVEVADEDIPTITLDEESVSNPTSPATASQQHAAESEPKSPAIAPAPAPARRTRLAPKAPLSVKVYPTPEEVALPGTPMPNSAAKYLTAEAVLDSSVPAGDSLSGKKAGLVYGLLALGLLGSPHSPTFNLASQPALSPRAPGSAHTPVFSPWLDTVRYPAMEAIQSPWMADAPHRSIGNVLFPQSPRVY
ncbi:hypothetical protein CERSUDRAFT_115161 [Gelatoporia subvermispora B]|uniref:Carrier domain-containing protein n=1 Tax=Ceriporiopsis subvermispora (strain B) TaxID=914234 RepID=M2RCR4_CERS8|nr:hypothetical protein CERSUDRAFT_115161 [Gelatoporia subvermispora B]